MSRKRQNKSTSFKLTDAYERKLLTFAESVEHGDYSKYVKRLIGRDMEGANRPAMMFADMHKEADDYSGFI